jgi:DNA primase
MDCIAVFMAGDRNVIASSGTAFTEAQVKLLGRYSKNIVVNFDPDAAGVAAAERSLGMLVAEDFDIKVLTLEPGFDPDLYIRRKGRQAYDAALKQSQRYFHYLIDRARSQFARTPEGKVKAVNYLLPHLQQVPHRIARDELAADIAQKLGIDSAVLRQELKHAAATRSSSIKAAPGAQITDAERIVIRALASGGEADEESGISDRSGEDHVPDLRRQAQYTLATEDLHRGLATESLLQALVDGGPEVGDPMSLPLTDPDRQVLASTLLREDEALTLELLEGAFAALRRRRLERDQRRVKAQIIEAERQNDPGLGKLLEEKLKIDRALAVH